MIKKIASVHLQPFHTADGRDAVMLVRGEVLVALRELYQKYNALAAEALQKYEDGGFDAEVLGKRMTELADKVEFEIDVLCQTELGQSRVIN